MDTIDRIAREIAEAIGPAPAYGTLAFVIAVGAALTAIFRRRRRSGELGLSMSFRLGGETGPGSATLLGPRIEVESVSDGTIVVGGRTIPVDGAALSDVQAMLREGRKIDAIKRLRLATSLGLAETKSIVDALDSMRSASR